MNTVSGTKDPFVRCINLSFLFWFSGGLGSVSLSYQYCSLARSALPVPRKPRNSYGLANPSHIWFEIGTGGGAKQRKGGYTFTV